MVKKKLDCDDKQGEKPFCPAGGAVIVGLLGSLTLGSTQNMIEDQNRHSHSTHIDLPVSYQINVSKQHGVNVPLSGHFLSDAIEIVTIAELLSDPTHYHRQTVKVRGKVTQPELHLDETRLFIDFVFVLKDGKDSLVVFGRHDQTQGNIQIVTDGQVEVTGRFWKDRTAHDYHFQNNVEAFTVRIFPSLNPDAA